MLSSFDAEAQTTYIRTRHSKELPEASDDQFLFVDDAQPSTTAQRRQARQHVMRKVAKRKKKLCAYSKYNVGQYPVIIDREQRSVGTGREWQLLVDHSTPTTVIPRSIPAKDYERAKIVFDFDLLSLAALTSIHFSKASAKVITSSRARLAGILRSTRNSSYLDYVPQLYGQNRLIRCVVDCTLARAKHTLTGDFNPPKSEVLLLYGKALLELQSAIQDPGCRFDGEVLCATHLLAICELLDLTSTGRWESHISGLIKLIEMRGAHRYVTEFEQSLLMSALGTIFRDTATSNKDCFLEASDWACTLLSIGMPSKAHDTCSDRDLEIWSLISPLPRLFRHATEYILSPNIQHPAEVMKLMLRCYAIKQKIDTCRMRLEKDMNRCLYKHSGKHQHCENLGVAMAANCMIQRLIVALEPRSNDALRLEWQAQELANGIIALSERAVAEGHAHLDLFLAQKCVVANAVVTTKDSWLEAARDSTGAIEAGRTHISRNIFRSFCSALGRRLNN